MSSGLSYSYYIYMYIYVLTHENVQFCDVVVDAGMAEAKLTCMQTSDLDPPSSPPLVSSLQPAPACLTDDVC